MSCPIQTPNTQVSDYAFNHGGVRPEVVGLIITSTGVEVTFREPSSHMLLSSPPRRAPDRIWKEVYEVNCRPAGPSGCLGWLELTSKEDGKHVPAHEVPESIVWPKEEQAKAALAKTIQPPRVGPTIYGR